MTMTPDPDLIPVPNQPSSRPVDVIEVEDGVLGALDNQPSA